MKGLVVVGLLLLVQQALGAVDAFAGPCSAEAGKVRFRVLHARYARDRFLACPLTSRAVRGKLWCWV